LIGEIIQRAVRRENITTGLAKIEATLWWDVKAGRFWAWEVDEHADWKLLATRALGLLIAEYGHLLKECPSPPKRGKAGEICGTWFVARRVNQEYCSAVCQSRASTRAFRAGTETPAVAKRRQEKGG